MCELFGACSKNGILLNQYLNIFFKRSDKHPHGWGLACLQGREAEIDKEAVQASKSDYLKERLSQPIFERCALAHIRYATIGNIGYQNCHPYSRRDESGRCWTLIHNGTIFDFPSLDKFVHVQTGETDSERILLYFIEEINIRERANRSLLSAEERFQLIDSIITKMSKGNKLNLLLYDGELLYVHTNYRNSLYFLEKDDGFLFSTVPLSEEDWKPVTFTTLLAYQNGVLQYQGTDHGNEYMDKEENLKFLYQIFSDL